MIFEQINKYPDPPVTTTTTFYGSHQQKTETEKAEWATVCATYLAAAQELLQPGDSVKLKLSSSTSQARVTIESFLTDPTGIYPYRNEPCFIMAVNPAYQSTVATRYALHELDLETIIKKEEKNVTNYLFRY